MSNVSDDFGEHCHKPETYDKREIMCDNYTIIWGFISRNGLWNDQNGEINDQVSMHIFNELHSP